MTNDECYLRLANQFDQHAGGAPKNGDQESAAFFEYLKLLYSPEQANLLQHLKPTTQFYASRFNVDDYTSIGRLSELSGVEVDKIRELLDPLVLFNTLQSNYIPADHLSEKEKAERGSKRVKSMIGVLGWSGFLRLMASLIKSNIRDMAVYGIKKTQGLVNNPLYALPIYPAMLNIHQINPAVREEDVQAGLLYQEFFIKEGYYKRYQTSDLGTPTFRTIPIHHAIQHEKTILDGEEAFAIIDASPSAVLLPCPCRTRTEKLGIRECKDKYPVAACLMLNLSAAFLEYIGAGQVLSKEKAKEYLTNMQQLGLVVATENFSDLNHFIICACCECCCSMLRGRTRWDNPEAMLPSNYVPDTNDNCVFCGKCAEKCPLEAISVSKDDKTFQVETERCIGCGVCTTACKKENLKLIRHERSTPPRDAQHMHDRIYSENKGPALSAEAYLRGWRGGKNV